MSPTTIVVCAEIADPSWRWLEGGFSDTDVRFEFARCIPKNIIERNAYFNLARLRGSFEAVRLARRVKAKVLVAHGPTLAAWCSLFARLFGLRIPIVAHSFNFTVLPSRLKRLVFTYALARVDRFIVYSTMERVLYAKTFDLPVSRFDVVLWGVRPPEVRAPETPYEHGNYVCALGGNARDYRTLIAAARELPEIQFVLVVWPASLQGLTLPPNVKVITSVPFEVAMNVLLHSQFMVLPLAGSEVPCGHVTLVAAMHLGKAFVVTDSEGVRDYVRNGENALTVTAGSAESLITAIKRLWHNPELCEQLGQNGMRFAARECAEERIVEHFRGWLQSRGLDRSTREARRQATAVPD